MNNKFLIQVLSTDFKTLNLVNLPHRLYKYRHWNSTTYPFHNTILIDNQIYMPPPSEFEDTLDCRNPVTYDELTDEELLQLCMRIFSDIHPKYNKGAITRLAAEQSKKKHLRDSKWIEELNEKDWQEKNQLMGILSLTTNELSNEMWKKYGDHHMGICYGFDTLQLIEDIEIGSGGKIHYADELPKISPLDEIDIRIFKNIYCKEKKWEFEEEYRLRKFNINTRLCKYSDKSLVEVILGVHLPENHIPAIIEVLSKKEAKPALYKCYNNDGNLFKKNIFY